MANLYGSRNTNQSLTGDISAKNPLNGNLLARGLPGKDGTTPHIGENGNWFIGETDTGIKAHGFDGAPGKDGKDGENGTPGVNGLTPHIGENGNWFIGETDTGVKALGEEGPPGKDGKDGEPGADGKDGAPGKSGVYVGSGEMPEDCNIQIDPSGETAEYVTKKEFNEFSNTIAGNTFIPIQDKVSGNNIVVTDSAKAPLKNLKLFGKSEQFTTGGNQLLNTNAFTILSGNGLSSVLNKDGSITVNGTPTLEYASVVRNTLTLEKGTYYISGGGLGNGKVFAQVTITKADGSKTYNRDASFTLDGTEKDLLFTIQADKMQPINNYTIKPMLNKGSTALSYEPYTGGIPSPNPEYPQAIESVCYDGNAKFGLYGKNILPNDAVTTVKHGITYTVNDDGSITVNGTATGQSSVKIYEGEFTSGYYLSGCPSGSDSGNLYRLQIVNHTNDRYTILARDEGSGSPIDISKFNTGYVEIVVPTGSVVSNITFYPMIRLASISDDTYEPYNKQSLTIPTPDGFHGIKVTDATLANYTDSNGDMYCCDEVDLERGKYIRRVKAMRVDSILSANPNTSNETKYLLSFDIVDMKVASWGFGMCDKFVRGTTKKDGIIRFGANNARIYIYTNDERLSDLEKANEYFSNNPIIIQYILATPIESDLTEEQIAQYKALTTNYPNTTILSDAHTEVEYIADTKKYIDKKFAELASALV